MGTFQTRRKLETILECDENSIDEEVLSAAAGSCCSEPDKKQPSGHSVQPRAPKRRRLLPPPTSILSAVRPMTFHDFRIATLEKYPSFSFLGPASMAVYWCKLFLKKEPFGWIHHSSPPSRDLKKRSQFWHIPGQYLTNRPPTTSSSSTTTKKDGPQWQHCVQDVLSRGEAGVHYATSYVGVYNLLRTYGRFGMGRRRQGEDGHGGQESAGDGGDNNDDDDDNDVILLSYHGPDLPPHPKPPLGKWHVS